VLILAIAIVIGLVVRLWVILHGVEVADVQHLHGIGIYFLQGKNPYRLPPFESNFPPIALYLEAAAVLASNAIKVPFHVLFKFWPLAADLGTTLAIFLLLRKSGQSGRWAAIWAAIFILNPVSILITAAHGNLDPVTNFFSVLALTLMIWNPGRLFAWSALALGIAIGIKPNPVFLVPILACYGGLSFRQRAVFCVICALPAGLTFIPFFIDTPSGVIGNVLGYTGELDFGYAAIMRLLWFFKTGSLNLPGTIPTDLSVTRLTFGAAYLAVLAYAAGRVHPARLAMLSYLLFYVLFTGLSAQYFVWIVPFAVIAGDWLVLAYSVWATLGLVGFYVYFWPPILFGDLFTLPDRLRTIAPFYFWSGVAMWSGNAVWLVIALRNLIFARPGSGGLDPRASSSEGGRLRLQVGQLRPLAVAIALATFALSLIPVFRIVAVVVQALRA
jgi:hypothetical protein